MHITHVIGFLFLLKIREIFIFNIMFTAFIKILPVGELPIHKPEITLSTNNATGEIKTIPQWRYGNCNGVFTCITENPQSSGIYQ